MSCRVSVKNASWQVADREMRQSARFGTFPSNRVNLSRKRFTTESLQSVKTRNQCELFLEFVNRLRVFEEVAIVSVSPHRPVPTPGHSALTPFA